MDAYFFPSAYARPMYHLLGSQLGPLVMSTAQIISDIECHIWEWPTDYDRSASYLADNLEATYSQYKMHLQLEGVTSIYTQGEYRLVHELLELVKGAVIKRREIVL